MILVVGATGQLGGLIARTLLDHGKPVRILVRGDSSYDHLVTAGAEPVTGDLKDPDSLPACCTGVEAIVTTANSAGRGGDDTVESVDRQGNRNLIEAATAAGVRHFVFTSVLGASPDSPVPFVRAKGETEQRLHDSGMAWTVLQPDAYMDTWVPMVVGGPALAGQSVTLVGEGRRRHFLSRHAGCHCLRPRNAGPRGQGSNPAHRRPEAGVMVGRHRGVQPGTRPRNTRAHSAARAASTRSARRRRRAAHNDGHVRLANRQQRTGQHLRRHTNIPRRVCPRLPRIESPRRRLAQATTAGSMPTDPGSADQKVGVSNPSGCALCFP